jgi:hypothetical protein
MQFKPYMGPFVKARKMSDSLTPYSRNNSSGPVSNLNKKLMKRCKNLVSWDCKVALAIVNLATHSLRTAAEI